MALKVGDLYISVTAAIGDALNSLTKLVDAVEKAAKEVKNAANDMGEIGAVVAAGIGAAVAAAAKSNPRLQAEITRLTDLLYTLAADIGDLFAPVVKQVTDFVSRLVATFQRLSPEVKRAGADAAVWVAGAGLAIGVVGKLAGVVEALSGSMGLLLKGLGALQKSTALAGLGAQVAALALPVAAVAAAVAGLALLAGALYGAWGDTSSGLKESVTDIIASITEMSKKLWSMLKGLFDGLVTLIEGMVVKSLDFLAWMIRELAARIEPLAKAAKLGTIHKALVAAQGITGQGLLDAAKEAGSAVASAMAAKMMAAEQVVEAGLTKAGEVLAGAKEAVGYGLGKSLEGLQKFAQDSGLTELAANLGAILKSYLSGPKLSTAEPDVRYSDGIDKELEYVEKVIAALNARAADESRMEYERSVAAEELRFNLVLDAQRLADAASKAMKDARQTLVSGLTAAFGRIKGLVEAFQQGTEASGSAWGGLVAVVARLLTESTGFLDLVNMVSNIVQRVADGLGELLVPMQPLIGAIGFIVDVVMNALEPLLTYVGQVLGYLAPLLVIVGKLLEGLAPLLSALTPPMGLIQDALKALFDVLKFVALVVLAVAQAIGTIWNAVVSAIQAIIKGLSKAVEWLGIDSLKKFANSMDKMKVDTDAMGDSMRDLRNTTWESADAQARQTAEVLKGTAALEKMNAALTNVPTAWKVALRRFEVQDAADGPGTPAMPGAGGGGNGSNGDRYRDAPQWFRDFMELPDALRERREDRSRDPYMGGRRGGEYIPKTSAVQSLKGPTYNLAINTIDPDEGVERAVRFVRRVDAMTKLADSGRRVSKSSRYGG
ncbi:hypothetical protein FJV41_22155 [Myxococcus llanfairpwllgwyngyllgogerychwyrndrobwllllantysiliogogogochensis]|uniref:Uncharacterized protein n=1 Tax=Myxococcus llanfairpwllgwyngyllgogerychwyrndrobwllllantysiliogogogochensis TaxID=2590453 RepID=A0A540WXM3_9BACT|nr:hypothetical protein [Myxococcus llanfairpwllgwyngyllgogerychwyrndrobwllllantysiliogogogochensis]TQF13752.1 hypothetical protein FJV41_22155 [Myxococcus llanfairpwllgwyngyllgogerychwyrndrobwllllantysiliogogogochensis]